MARINAIEKLAREICWMGFSPNGRTGKTKNRYWLSITEDARQQYRASARHFAWVLEKIPVEMLNEVSAFSSAQCGEQK
jgi:hypothetical protein